MRYRLQSPVTLVHDADIRGLVDGTGKYQFNQGRSYHMRVGRRYHGANEAAFELKRALVRFEIPDLPAGSRVGDVELSLWVEAFLSDSPLAQDSAALLPLHAYLYPLDLEWKEGRGGVDLDDFSGAARGEVDWLSARAGEVAWPAPGALQQTPSGNGRAYSVSALATAMVVGDNRWLRFSGPLLTEYVDSLRAEGDLSASFLVKLDDAQEDHWGTEMAFLTSQYGIESDYRSRRPLLVLDVDVPGPRTVLDVPFTLEAGEELELPRPPVANQMALMAADIEGSGGIPPQVAIETREGGGSMPLHNPTTVSGDVKLTLSAAPHPMELGRSVALAVTASWIKPGPRSVQVPDFMFIAPSGTIHHVRADSADHRSFVVNFTPLELGLWRYAWTFRPGPEWPQDSHRGEGIFSVAPPRGATEADRLREFTELVLNPDSIGSNSPQTQRARANSLIRWNRRYRLRNEKAETFSDSLLEQIRAVLPAGQR